MTVDAGPTGYVITGYQTMIALICWGGVVLFHVLLRVAWRPTADPIRPSGPIE